MRLAAVFSSFWLIYDYDIAAIDIFNIADITPLFRYAFIAD
jgi:hypothetical protein